MPYTTMQRRKFLIGAGSIATGTAAAMGTGAFTSVTADRSVNVTVADDSDALLAMDKKGSSASDPNANRAYANESGDAISIDISGGNGNLDESPAGVNTDAATKIYDIFTVTNQGTQNAFVYVDPSTAPQGIKPDADNDGDLEYGESDGEAYIDPQATDLPNAINAGTNGRLSLTGIYGVNGDDVTNGFQNSSAYDPKDLTLKPGESFDFGLVIKVDGDSIPDVTFDIVADADLAADI